jgi:hypothetical protein
LVSRFDLYSGKAAECPAAREKELKMARPTTPPNAPAKTSSKHPLGTDAEGILEELTTRQHLTPQRTLGEVVAETVESAGVCPDAAKRALTWLNLSPDRSIGRLRRGELIQLARSMYRFWLESVSTSAPVATPR